MEDTIQSEMLINMNWKKLFQPTKYAEDVAKAVKDRETKRKRGEKKYEMVLAKRARKGK